MNDLSYYLFNIAFTMIFAILGVFISFTHVQDHADVKNYVKAKKTLGFAFFLMTSYCIIRVAFPQLHLTDHHELTTTVYNDFSLLVLFSLVFSWLNYSSFMLLMDSASYDRRRFLIDGLTPLAVLLVVIAVGEIWPNAQNTCVVLIGITYIIKCVYMFYICEKEYRKCIKDLDNYYDQEVDLQWIRILIWLTFALSIMTVIGFYIKEIHYFSDIAAPISYVYMVIKIINWGPKRIDSVRAQYSELTSPRPVNQETLDKNEQISKIILPKLQKWVESKHFCTPELTIKDVANDMGTNHNYLSRYINNELGVTFQVWLNTLRIEESKQMMLHQPKISIEEIGIKVGIPQIYNFSRWFKQVTGETPFRWRKQQTSNS